VGCGGSARWSGFGGFGTFGGTSGFGATGCLGGLAEFTGLTGLVGRAVLGTLGALPFAVGAGRGCACGFGCACARLLGAGAGLLVRLGLRLGTGLATGGVKYAGSGSGSGTGNGAAVPPLTTEVSAIRSATLGAAGAGPLLPIIPEAARMTPVSVIPTDSAMWTRWLGRTHPRYEASTSMPPRSPTPSGTRWHGLACRRRESSVRHIGHICDGFPWSERGRV
jgi:hypothetical protein